MAFDKESIEEVKEAPHKDKPKKKEPAVKQPRFKVSLDNPKALLNVRSAPKQGDNIIGTLNNGTEIFAKGVNGDYTVITYKDHKAAYVLTKKLKEI